MNYYDVIFAQQKAKKDSEYFGEISDAINVLAGTETTYTPAEMADAILDAIPTETASGNPINITDAANFPAESVVTTLEPVQDLHGYDKPWPGGGNVNFLPQMVDGTYEGNGLKAVVSNGIATLSGTSTIAGNALVIPLSSSVTLPSSFYYYCGNSVVNLSLDPSIENSQNTSEQIHLAFQTVNRISEEITGKEGQTFDRIRFYVAAGITISGTYAPMFCLTNTVTAFTPYSNECPITGHTGVELTRTGKNLLPMTVDGIKAINSSGTWNGNIYTTNNITFEVLTDSNGNITGITVNASLPATAETTFRLCYTPIFTGNAVLSGCPSSGSTSTYILQYSNSVNTAVNDTGNGVNISQYDYTQYPNSACLIGIYAGYQPNNLIFKPMIRLSTDTPETHSITFPQAQSPVYGCKVDWIEGVLRVNRKFVTATNSNIGNGSISAAGLNLGKIADDAKPFSNGSLSTVKSDSLATVTADTMWNSDANSVAVNSSGRVLISIAGITRFADLQTYLSNNPIQVCYELATPIEYDLTPEVITLLKGENNVWTDAGESEIEYKVDLNSYIQKLIDEASTQASALSVSPLSLGKSAVLTSTDGEDGEEIEEVAEPAEEKEEAEDLTAKKEIAEELAKTEKVEDVKETEEHESEVEE